MLAGEVGPQQQFGSSWTMGQGEADHPSEDAERAALMDPRPPFLVSLFGAVEARRESRTGMSTGPAESRLRSVAGCARRRQSLVAAPGEEGLASRGDVERQAALGQPPPLHA